LAPSCSVHGQDGPLPRRATVSPAPPPPHATRSESMAPQILRLGPPSSNGRIQPAGGSGTLRGLQIGYLGLMHRWIITTRAWLGAANPLVGSRFSRFAFSVRRGLICCRGVRARVSAQTCEKGRPRLQLHHRWGRARSWQASCAHQRVSSVGPRAFAAVWRPSLGCPLGRSLPRLPVGWRGLARVARLSPDGGPPRQHPAVGVRGSIPRVGPLGTGVRPCCCGVSASR